MAIDVTTLAMVGITQPIIAPQSFPGSPIPRASLVFTNTGAGEEIPVEAGGDSQSVNLNVSLSPGFGYALRQFSVFIFGDDFADWSAAAWWCFKDRGDTEKNAVHIDGSATGVIASNGTTTTVKGKNYVIDGIYPTRLMIATGPNSKFCFRIDNPTVDGSLMRIRALVEFWVYDVDQSYTYAINTPVLTR